MDGASRWTNFFPRLDPLAHQVHIGDFLQECRSAARMECDGSHDCIRGQGRDRPGLVRVGSIDVDFDVGAARQTLGILLS